jgi:hypothetical protein
MDFVDVIGYEGLYKINQAGEIFGVKRQKLLKNCINKHGYYVVNLCKEGNIKNCQIHRLLAIQFLPNPLNLFAVDHIDQNKLNYSLNNLRWITDRDNNLNRSWSSASGEYNIYKTQYNTFRVNFKLEKKDYAATFKTLEEAKVHRDLVIVKNNLGFNNK